MITCRNSMGHFLAAGAGVLFLFASVWAQDTVSSGPARSGPAESGKSLPPQPPLPKPPVDQFRSLLAMTPSERQEALAKRSPEARKLILAKIHEYQALKPEDRQLRLRVTELRWYLLPLLNSAATNRVAQLASVPADLRESIDARLQQWDKLGPDVQKQLLDNESTVRFYFELATATPQQRASTLTNVSASAQNDLQFGIRRWQHLTNEQRESIVSHFREYFDLTRNEKEKVLQTLSEPERLQLEKTLRTYEGLSSAQRAECLRSFQKFASLSQEERQQFLKNAERWERMSPSERESWRNLVSALSRQPPLPPGLLPPRPPLPRQVVAPPGSPSFATNSL